LGCATQALELARAASHSEQERECLRVLGALLAHGGEYVQAEAFLQESIDLCRKQNDSYRQGLALLELGHLHARLSKTGQAGQQENQALAAYAVACRLFE